MLRDKVILVNSDDADSGEMDKLEAHQKGLLHRAFSIFIFNSKGELLLQQRAAEKYHGGGLWSNTCCSHPQTGEGLTESANERLGYEMGLNCDIREAFSFIYHAEVENQLIEHEYDHVFIGYTDQQPTPNHLEVKSFRWIAPSLLKAEIATEPGKFTVWFKQCLERVLSNI